MPNKKTKRTRTKKDLSATQKVKLGVGITAAAVAAAGTYFLYGAQDAKKNRTKVRSWALKAKAEVLEALEQAKHMTPEEYEALVEGVVGSYGKLRNVTNTELKAFEKEMKSHWGRIEKSVKLPIKKKAAAKKTTRK